MCVKEYGWWLLFPVLDLVIGLFNIFSGILPLPLCQVYIVFYFQSIFNPQVVNVDWVLKVLKCVSNVQCNTRRDIILLKS